MFVHYGVPRAFLHKGKMAKGAGINLPKLFTQLQLAGEDGDYEWGLEVVKEILKIEPDDMDALSCKVTCLIQTSEFEESLDLINLLSKREGKRLFLYEQAYCMYKQEKYNESLKLLDELSLNEKDSIRISDLRAQVNYRLHNYEESAKGFQRGSQIDKDNNERSANMAASLSYCSKSTVESILSATPVGSTTMEQCFNLATVYLMAMKDFEKGEHLLRKAEKLCKESDNLEEDEIEQELIPIRIQLGYTLQGTGQVDEALSLYNTVLKQKPTNTTYLLTAANNIIVLNGDKDIFDSKKKIKLLSNEEALKKLNKLQEQLVLFNRCLFSLKLNHLEQCRQLLVQLKDRFPNTDLSVVAEATLLNREKKTQESLSLLSEYITSNPIASLEVYLLLTQLYWNQSNISKVCETLEMIPEVPKYLGVVSFLVTQLKAIGDIDGCMRILDNVFRWWKSLAGSCSEILWEIAQFKMACERPQEATEVLEYLHRENPSNTRYLATLISAYSRFNPHKAEELARSLPSATLASSLDIDSLEHVPSFHHSRARGPRVQQQAGGTGEDREVLTTKEHKKKKKRKKRLPKNYDPSKVPDPERWLPLRERSYYRSKSKKKAGQSAVGRGTQGMSGSMASMASKLDASRPKEEPVVEAGPSPRGKQHHQQSKKPSQQKKKKKGRH